MHVPTGSIAFVSMGHYPSGFRVGGISNVMAGWAQALTRRYEVHVVAVYDTVPDDLDRAFATHAHRLAGVRKHVVGSPAEAAEVVAGIDLVSLHQEAHWLPHLPRAGLMMHNPPCFAPGRVWPPAATAGALRAAIAGAPSRQACSRWLAGLIEAEVDRPVDVVTPFVAAEFVEQPRVGKGRHLVWAGRLVANKGLADAAAAAGRLGVELLVTDVTPGVVDPDTADFRDRLRRLPGVRLVPPPSSPAEMAGLFAAASAVVLPSVGEPFGMVSIEAQASGTRTVVYDDAGLPETVGPAAVAVPVGDLDALTGAVRDALDAPDVPDADRARIAERFGLDRSVRALLRSLGGDPGPVGVAAPARSSGGAR
ncbi:glycosyltransferase family 4 protein [Micromonospora sp. WMMD1076]|uniref:glycosyltransferase family 4 protein n=1 Tax=Micromonospora sp. WMMD1076 TaxID=3016103 RepID=UPI00249CBA16|nr:glycosyltransferase family 4 protein [Micromonospora sp. WMMD1076]WFF06198.1 glycosyltransferase family 4 protein [Micromonospora sp. WMMD1076]